MPADVVSTAERAARLFRLSIGMYFTGGFLTSLVSLPVPRLKLLAGLSYAQAALVQFAAHFSYFVLAFPVTMMIVRIGYMRALGIGAGVVAAACASLIVAGRL